jgi:exosome complex RNA-binding protein Rrp42 (RNase PH superfamily)
MAHLAPQLEVTTFQRLHPRTYLERFLAENIRPDGRNLQDFREVSVNTGTGYARSSNLNAKMLLSLATMLG